MKRVYTSPHIDGVYVLDYSNTLVKSKKEGLNTPMEFDDADCGATRKEGYQRGFNDAMKDIETAKQEAYRKGMIEGGKQSEDKLSTAFHSLQSVANELLREKDTVWQKSEIEIIKLVLAITNKVIGYEIANNHQLIEKVVEDAVAHAGKHKIVAIRLNPADVAKLKDVKLAAGPNDTFNVIEDQKISPGGCVVETDFGSVDAQLETRIDNVINQILSQHESSEHVPCKEAAPES